MKTQSMLLAALASAPVAFAHTAFTNFYVDGQDQVRCEQHCVGYVLMIDRATLSLCV